ncbi:hypothetical protein C8F04DRAFT_1069815 [Mycena alexandri]|uniref:Uncharacterized protein n=1 Tax=Mycena alexandri TaxID=1745969 RepID=A0AAD6TGT0_9AGAR|nr:hypothetical protein C8F04DRAFT_1069815 [Mycena alexandri]
MHRLVGIVFIRQIPVGASHALSSSTFQAHCLAQHLHTRALARLHTGPPVTPPSRLFMYSGVATAQISRHYLPCAILTPISACFSDHQRVPWLDPSSPFLACRQSDQLSKFNPLPQTLP